MVNSNVITMAMVLPIHDANANFPSVIENVHTLVEVTRSLDISLIWAFSNIIEDDLGSLFGCTITKTKIIIFR